MAYDATKMADWQISEAAEKKMPTPEQWQQKLGLAKEEMLPMGRLAKLDFLKIIERLKDKPDGKYIEVTAITPTPLGEGKTTTSMGLVEGLGKRGKNVGGALRQPSGGPTMNVKGTAAGGGNALLHPDDRVLARPDRRHQRHHERPQPGHGRPDLAACSTSATTTTSSWRALTKMRRLDIDPTSVEMGWIIDFCAQSLRNIIIGIGGKHGRLHDAVQVRHRGRLRVHGHPVHRHGPEGHARSAWARSPSPSTRAASRSPPGDLEVAGAMTAWMGKTINPTLMQTPSTSRCFVHAGPFANIAIGQSSIIADRIGLKLFDYHVTESGFGADIGFEKFWNLKCRIQRPQAPTSRCSSPPSAPSRCTAAGPGRARQGAARRIHQGEPRPGGEGLRQPGPPYQRHPQEPASTRWSASTASTPTPTPKSPTVRRLAERPARASPCPSTGRRAAKGPSSSPTPSSTPATRRIEFKFLYPLEMPLRERIELIAKEVYGADGVSWTAGGRGQGQDARGRPQVRGLRHLMVKTHLSLTHDPTLKGVPKGWTLPIRDVLIYGGAKFLCPWPGRSA